MSDSFGTAGAAARMNNMVSITSGATSQNVEVAGKTVAQARTELKDLMSIDGKATAYKGKVKLEDSYILQPNDQIRFIKASGEKGLS